MKKKTKMSPTNTGLVKKEIFLLMMSSVKDFTRVALLIVVLKYTNTTIKTFIIT